MTVTTKARPTVVGPRATPITIAAAEQLEVDTRGGTAAAGLLIWARLLDAQRDTDVSRKRGERSHGFISSYAKVQMLSLTLADIYGKAPLFWEMEVREALDTPVGDYV